MSSSKHHSAGNARARRVSLVHTRCDGTSEVTRTGYDKSATCRRTKSANSFFLTDQCRRCCRCCCCCCHCCSFSLLLNPSSLSFSFSFPLSLLPPLSIHETRPLDRSAFPRLFLTGRYFPPSASSLSSSSSPSSSFFFPFLIPIRCRVPTSVSEKHESRLLPSAVAHHSLLPLPRPLLLLLPPPPTILSPPGCGGAHGDDTATPSPDF